MPETDLHSLAAEIRERPLWFLQRCRTVRPDAPLADVYAFAFKVILLSTLADHIFSKGPPPAGNIH